MCVAYTSTVIKGTTTFCSQKNLFFFFYIYFTIVLFFEYRDLKCLFIRDIPSSRYLKKNTKKHMIHEVFHKNET